MEVRFRPLTPLTFRPPGPFEAGVHGPAAVGASYSYPPPLTVVGALLAFHNPRPPCNLGGDADDLEDVEARLDELGVRAVRPGLLAGGGGRQGYYAYIGWPVHPSLERLAYEVCRALADAPTGAAEARMVAGALRRLIDPGARWCGGAALALRSSRVGIALDRARKTALEGMIYGLDTITYTAPDGGPADIVVLVDAAGRPWPCGEGRPVRLGKRGLVLAEAWGDAPAPREVLMASRPGQPGRWALVLLTPALLEKPPGPPPPDPRGLAGALLSGSPLEGVDASVVYMPRNEYYYTVSTVGWRTRNPDRMDGSPRKPHVIVPPGTVLVVEGAALSQVERAVEEGVGAHSRLGWGTIYAVPLPPRCT